MRYMLCALLLFGMTAVGQQQAPMPGTTPPTFPRQTSPSRSNPSRIPPDTAAPPPAGSKPTTGEVQQQIDWKRSQEPALANTAVRFDVNDQAVIVSGSVPTEQQHQLALRLANSYAGDRKVQDYVKVAESTTPKR